MGKSVNLSSLSAEEVKAKIASYSPEEFSKIVARAKKEAANTLCPEGYTRKIDRNLMERPFDRASSILGK